MAVVADQTSQKTRLWSSGQTEQSLISVVIPTHNAVDFLDQAIGSVLSQTYRHYELIVVDDGSTDSTRKVVEGFSGCIKYFYQDQQGPSAARNAGIRHAGGDYICFLDADDLWMPDKLQTQLDFMTEHGNIGLVFSDEEEFDGDQVLRQSLLAKTLFHSEITSQVPIREACQKLLIENFVPTSSVMIRRECFSRVGLFDECLAVSEDRDLWFRIATQFNIACIPVALAKKRTHPGGISRNAELTHRCRIHMWKKNFQHFPNRILVVVVDRLLAQAYLELGYILLAKDQQNGAREAALRSLYHAVKAAATAGSPDGLISPYRWLLGIGLIPLSLIGWPKNRLFAWIWRSYKQRRVANGSEG